MKTLIIIWGMVILSAIAVTTYINITIDNNVKATPPVVTGPGIPVKDHITDGVNYNPQQTVNGASLQGGN